MSDNFQNQLIRLSICISDIPKGKIKKSSSGKLYADVVVVGRKAPDQYGNDITVYASQTKEEQAAKAEKEYCGQGKIYSFELKPATDSDIEALGEGATVIEPRQPRELPPPAQDDLPF